MLPAVTSLKTHEAPILLPCDALQDERLLLFGSEAVPYSLLARL